VGGQIKEPSLFQTCGSRIEPPLEIGFAYIVMAEFSGCHGYLAYGPPAYCLIIDWASAAISTLM
jgi:hypothetical protein